MERKYTMLAILLVVLALGLVVLPKNNDRKEIAPQNLLSSIAEKSRYLTADQVTHRIIENDPTLLLVDLRSPDQFKTFALPGAVNIQPDSLLSKSTLELFNQPGKDKVLFGNEDLTAEKAWIICSRYAVNRMYIMKGGLNEWFNTIIKEQTPSETASSTDLDLISFRNAARQFFTGKGSVSNTTVTTPSAEKIKIVRKVPSASAGGGC